MRSEFSTKVKREALDRADERCEGLLSSGERCNTNIKHKPCHFDHVIPDAIGGKNDLQNCQVLCVECHKVKTAKRDMPVIAKTKRNQDNFRGIKKPRTITRWRNFRGEIVQASRERT